MDSGGRGFDARGPGKGRCTVCQIGSRKIWCSLGWGLTGYSAIRVSVFEEGSPCFEGRKESFASLNGISTGVILASPPPLVFHQPRPNNPHWRFPHFFNNSMALLQWPLAVTLGRWWTGTWNAKHHLSLVSSENYPRDSWQTADTWSKGGGANNVTRG